LIQDWDRFDPLIIGSLNKKQEYFRSDCDQHSWTPPLGGGGEMGVVAFFFGNSQRKMPSPPFPHPQGGVNETLIHSEAIMIVVMCKYNTKEK